MQSVRAPFALLWMAVAGLVLGALVLGVIVAHQS
jgi:hypothetical protein